MIGSLSDIYSLYYSNYWSKLFYYLDIFHVNCISMPSIYYIIYKNKLQYKDHHHYLIAAILFWINGFTIRKNNEKSNKNLYYLSMYNHILWHVCIGTFSYKLL